jgi:hypothetical protein
VSEKMVSLAGSTNPAARLGCPLKGRTRVMRVVSHDTDGAGSNDTRQNRRLPVTGMRHQARLHNECAESDVAHEYSPMTGRVIERLKIACRRPTLVDLGSRIARSVALDQCEQRRPVRRMQPDAAVRGRVAEPRELIGAVNGEAIIEEDRMASTRCNICARNNTAPFPCYAGTDRVTP